MLEIRSGVERHTIRPQEVNLLGLFFLVLMDKQNVSLEQLKVKFVIFGDLEEEPVTSEVYILKCSIFTLSPSKDLAHPLLCWFL